MAEAPEADIGLGRARIDEMTRRCLRVGADDSVEIEGKRQTVALVQNLLPEDEGKGVIRIDGLVRQNAKVSPGDKVIVRKTFVTPAEEIEFAPVISEGHRISFGLGIENFVKRGLLKRPLKKGDVVTVPGIALRDVGLPFMVVYTKPEGNIQIHEATTITMREALRQIEFLSPEELLQELVDRVTEKLSTLLADFAEQLGTLSGEPGQKAKTLTDKIRAFIQDMQRKENL